ncbi:MAG: bacillithiol system redox-active protein YtxJ [Bacteroidota bacterium]
MGLLDRMMNRNSNIHRDWKTIDQLDQLDAIIEQSKDRPVVLFKHSTTCGISAMSKHQLEQRWDFKEEELDFYYLDLLRYRPISNAIADRLSVIHQSPQIILLKDGKAVYSTSHHKISVADLRAAMARN